MKKVLSFVLVIAILCTISVPCFAANPSVSIKTSNTAAVGETITVSVNLSANSGLAGLKFAVSFDTSEFQLVSGSAQTSSLFTALPVEKTNSVEFSGVSVNAVNTGGTLLTFKLKVIKTGGKISLRVLDAIDGSNQSATVSASGATVKCSHADTKWVVTKNATCTEKGVETGTCTCGNVSTRDIPMLKHNFGEWKVVTKSTEIQKGLKERTCKICGTKETAEIAKIGSTETTTQAETKTETETITELQTQSETHIETTEQEIQTSGDVHENKKDIATPIIVGIVFFVLGASVGIGAALFIIKRKSKEEQ